MSEITDLHQIRRRISRLVAFEDGLFDLLLGIIYMFLAIYPVTRQLLGPEWNIVLFLSLVVLASVGQLVAHRLVSLPRIGYVRSRRSRGMILLIVITAVMVLITFGLVLLTFLGPGSEPAPDLPTGTSSERSYLVEIIVLLVMGILFSALGYLFGVRRLYFYGWMIGLANLASVYMSHNAGWTFLIPLAVTAGIILLIGFMLLVSFLRKYSLRTAES